MGLVSGGAGMRKCSTCSHVFYAHGPDGCRKCGCTAVRGGLFKPETPPEEIVRTLRLGTEPKHCEVCGETHGPDNPIRAGEYERHGLLRVDEATMLAYDPIEPMSDEELKRWAAENDSNYCEARWGQDGWDAEDSAE